MVCLRNFVFLLYQKINLVLVILFALSCNCNFQRLYLINFNTSTHFYKTELKELELIHFFKIQLTITKSNTKNISCLLQENLLGCHCNNVTKSKDMIFHRKFLILGKTAFLRADSHQILAFQIFEIIAFRFLKFYFAYF